MWTRPIACALAGSALLGCGGRADLADYLATRTTRAPEQHASSPPGASATVDAGDTAEGGSGDAGAECVILDLSTYDRSCTSDSDCLAVTSGLACGSACLCPNDAINAIGRTRYERAIAPLSGAASTCSCPVERALNPVCVQGVCTYQR